MSEVYFDPAAGGDGSTVSDDASASTGLQNGGHRTRFSPSLANIVSIGNQAVAKSLAASASASAAAASASAAAGSATTANTKAAEAAASASAAATSAAGTSAAVSAHAASGDHDGRYYTKTQVDTALTGKAASSHTHTIANVTGLQTALDGKAANSNATESAAGVAEVATQAETDSGTDDTRIVTPKKLRFGFGIVLGTEGYIAFPSWLGGLIFKWGELVSASNPNIVSFSPAFPTACYAIFTQSEYAGPNYQAISVTGRTRIGFSMYVAESGVLRKWFAIGK